MFKNETRSEANSSDPQKWILESVKDGSASDSMSSAARWKQQQQKKTWFITGRKAIEINDIICFKHDLERQTDRWRNPKHAEL